MGFGFSRSECLNLEDALKHEWLETNGLGGYAATTIVNCHTRKYHGMLAATIPELNEKFVLLSKLEPSIHINDREFRFSTNKFPGVFDPTGHKYLEEVNCELHPQFQYHVGDISFRISVLMPRGKNAVLFRYELLEAENPLTLHLKPLLAYRSIHTLNSENMYLRVKSFIEEGHYKFDPYENMPPLFMRTSVKSFIHPGPFWMEDFEFLKERSRGFDYKEDLFCPGIIELGMKAGDVVYLRAGLEIDSSDIESEWSGEIKRRTDRLEKFDDPFPLNNLKMRAEQFIITRADGKKSIVAGYPWFAEWGRDTMIALAGLTTECGDTDSAVEIIRSYCEFEKTGLIPNYLPLSNGEAAYNSVDASLWMILAIHRLYLIDASLVDEFKPVVKRILESFASGETPDVSLQDSGLIWVGNEGTQLTWMDARANGKPVTPRYGMAVELNVLWINALNLTIEWEDSTENLESICEKASTNFAAVFYDEERGYLADVVNDKGQDWTIRPNQIFAVSVPNTMLSKEQKSSIVDVVKKHLLTPYGLRSLSPLNPGYSPHYGGSPDERDSAYHQGTVWSWLIGSYAEAVLTISDDVKADQAELYDTLIPLFTEHCSDACVGAISEIFNADPPHSPKGAFAQAWGLAEVIRTWNMIK
ncbi:MAG: glycogen debranching enzyme N-terminal domain-containing protein, partial [Lentisphaeria bacterium]|nr:glycogen debranching enzyme N-terminal domain-containing protein [Lentisphaeria bacterium]